MRQSIEIGAWCPQNLPQPIRQLNAHLSEKPTFQGEVCILAYFERYVKMLFRSKIFPKDIESWIRIGDLHPGGAVFFGHRRFCMLPHSPSTAPLPKRCQENQRISDLGSLIFTFRDKKIGKHEMKSWDGSHSASGESSRWNEIQELRARLGGNSKKANFLYQKYERCGNSEGTGAKGAFTFVPFG